MSDRYYAFIPQTTVYSKELNALPATARWVYVIMVAEDHGLYAPFQIPYKRIHSITGFSTSTIHRAVEDLVNGGFMEYDHGGLEQNPNVYELNTEWLKLGRKEAANIEMDGI